MYIYIYFLYIQLDGLNSNPMFASPPVDDYDEYLNRSVIVEGEMNINL